MHAQWVSQKRRGQWVNSSAGYGVKVPYMFCHLGKKDGSHGIFELQWNEQPAIVWWNKRCFDYQIKCCIHRCNRCTQYRLAGCPHFIIGQIYLSRVGPIVGTFKSVPIIKVSATYSGVHTAGFHCVCIQWQGGHTIIIYNSYSNFSTVWQSSAFMNVYCLPIKSVKHTGIYMQTHQCKCVGCALARIPQDKNTYNFR